MVLIKDRARGNVVAAGDDEEMKPIGGPFSV